MTDEHPAHVGSVFTNEQELLSSVIKLYCPKGIQLDPMFFKGNFYKQIPKPSIYSDINPQDETIPKADARKLDIESNSIESMILDPPFMFNIHGKDGVQGEYYSSKTHGIFPSFRELSLFYQEIIHEAFRVLKKKGVLIFKCQDYTDSKTTLTHCFVNQWANEVGFRAEDIAILHLSRGKIANHQTTQRHLRKHHSYFLVLIK